MKGLISMPSLREIVVEHFSNPEDIVASSYAHLKRLSIHTFLRGKKKK